VSLVFCAAGFQRLEKRRRQDPAGLFASAAPIFRPMESSTREMTHRGIVARMSDAPDLLIIAAWTALICCIATLRVDFIGDGIRHLDPILADSRPQLGPPRWLLFPAFLFAIIKPLQMAGIVDSLGGAARVFLALDVFAGVAYMLLIRNWLLARSVAASPRAAGLLIAGMTMPMLRFSGDIVEVIIPATIALAGLVYLASRPPEAVNQGLSVAAAAIAFAALLYQGIILAVALVPCAIPRGATIRRRTIILFFAILAVTPLLMVTTIVANGASARTAIHLMLTGEENVLYRDRLESHRLPLWERPVAATSLGAARSIIAIPDNRGVSGAIQLLSHRATFIEGAADLSGCLLALAMVVTGAVVVVRRMDWRIAIAFVGILTLPTIRGYAYLKLYGLMPAVVALVAAVSPPTIVFGAGAIVGAFNVTYLARDISRDRKLARDIAPLYQSAGPAACWLTTAWGPPIFGWPGWTCSMTQVLTDAHTDQLAAMIDENNAAMVSSFRSCFCNSSAVYTDDVTESSKETVAALANYYRFAGIDSTRLLWNPQRGSTVFDRDGIVAYVYARQSQSEICDSLKSATTNTSR
jgi:hypothetical protein